MYITIAFLTAATSILFYYVIRAKKRDARFYQLLRQFSSLPSYYPIIGNAHLLYGKIESALDRFYRICEGRSTPFVFWLGYIPVIVVTELEDIQEVTSKCSHRETLGFVEETFLNGIVTQKYEQWRKTRRLLNPAFGPIMMKHYLKVFNEQAHITCEILRKRANTGETVDLWPYMVNASIDITTENITGIKMNIQVNYGNEYSEAIVQIFNLTVKRVLNPFLHPKIIFDFYMAVTSQQKIVKIVHDFAREAVIQAKRKYKLQQLKSKNPAPGDQMTDKEPKTTIEILLASHDIDPNLSEKQMQAEFIHIIAAGTESTAITLGFLMVMFGIYQDIQEKVYQEIKSVMGDRKQVTVDDLMNFPFLEQCIKETIRVFTVLPTTIRCTNEELTLRGRLEETRKNIKEMIAGDALELPLGEELKNLTMTHHLRMYQFIHIHLQRHQGNKIIPANCMIAVMLKSVHENADFFPNPQQWNPDNFSRERVQQRPKNSFVGFSLGARACLGAKYAMTSMKTQSVCLLRHFHIRTNCSYEDVVTIMDVMQRSKNGYPVILHTRDG